MLCVELCADRSRRICAPHFSRLLSATNVSTDTHTRLGRTSFILAVVTCYQVTLYLCVFMLFPWPEKSEHIVVVWQCDAVWVQFINSFWRGELHRVTLCTCVLCVWDRERVNVCERRHFLRHFFRYSVAECFFFFLLLRMYVSFIVVVVNVMKMIIK